MGDMCLWIMLVFGDYGILGKVYITVLNLLFSLLSFFLLLG